MYKIVLFLLLGLVGEARAETIITGAGATFPYPIYAKWFHAYNQLHPEVKINYQSIGSGGGIRQVSDTTVDFGASDAPMTDEEMKKTKVPLLHLPTVIGADGVAYNVSGVPSGLKFSRAALAGIFLGEIKKWNDPEIARVNPTIPLPDKPIMVVHRSDGSGTTMIWTDYLSKISLAWKNKVGVGTSVKWPVGIGGKGNEGVAGLIQRMPFSLGYVSLNYAVEQKMTIGAVDNGKGKYILPNLQNVSAAAASFKMPDDFRVMITNPPSDEAYPISGFTWLLLPKTGMNPQKKKDLMDFLKWMFREGQSLVPSLHYAPLPQNLIALEEAALATLK